MVTKQLLYKFGQGSALDVRKGLRVLGVGHLPAKGPAFSKPNVFASRIEAPDVNLAVVTRRHKIVWWNEESVDNILLVTTTLP